MTVKNPSEFTELNSLNACIMYYQAFGTDGVSVCFVSTDVLFYVHQDN